MGSRMFRRATMVAGAAVVFLLFSWAALGSGTLSSARVILAVAAVVFGYIVVRLAESMFAASPSERRKARRGLIVAAAVPALVLTPTAIGSAPAEFTPMILLGSMVWLALVLSYTSFILGSATRARSPQAARIGHAGYATSGHLRPKSMARRAHRA